MAFQIFTKEIPSSCKSEDTLNRFLDTHEIVSVDKQWVTRNNTPFLVFVVEYADGRTAGATSTGTQSGASPGNAYPARKNYQEVFSEEDFKLFEQLRKMRRSFSESEKVMPYVIFNNAQLEEIVKTKVHSLSALEKVAGVGEARVKKYGTAVLEIMSTSKAQPEAKADTKKDNVPSTTPKQTDAKQLKSELPLGAQ
jgi:superfamily II DNA helicase RecQ